MDHALVIGGSGMLAGVTRALGERGPVTVVARELGALERLRTATVTPLPMDYTDGDQLHGGLRSAVARHGPVDLCVAWIHSTAPEAPLDVARYVQGRYFHVLGSASADPTSNVTGSRAAFEALGGVDYHEVILGFVRESGGSRWLTNEEICAGVLEAVDAPAARRVVGTVEPWAERP
ncbi:MAG: Rossmann-fold NAD(P)-binding domain-containing protein [Planctomycetota bacterium]|jgi:hypothetical protein